MALVSVVLAAARNNAERCDAFCRTYGVAGVFHPDYWTSPERTPPLYPDAVTLVPGVAGGQLLSQIDASDGCSVKDSFGDLDLTMSRANGRSSEMKSNSKNGRRHGVRRPFPAPSSSRRF